MRVLFFLRYFRDQASSRVRGFDMIRELRRRGVRCDIIYGHDRKVYVSFLLKLFTHDTIYFQKRYSKNDLLLHRLARLLGRKTLFDIDDAPEASTSSADAEERAVEIMGTSSAVIVGSHQLRDFAKDYNEHVYLIPSSVCLDYYRPRDEEDDRDYLTLGWVGNGRIYKRDLGMLVRPLESVGNKHRIKLAIVGARGEREIYEHFGGLSNVRAEITDWVSSVDPHAIPGVISRFDIGLYPLLDNKYNRYKCSLKALEYMAMKVPVVASPVGENKIVIEPGREGFLPSSEREWEECVLRLIENKDLRRRMGEMGRKKVERRYSTEVCARELLSVLGRISR